MNIPGKLREDLKRIYGANDPLHYIEDIKAETNPDTCQEELVVRLRVPRHYERYIPEVYITSASPLTVDHWAKERFLRPVNLSPSEVSDLRKLIEGGCRPHFFESNAVKFVKPAKVFLNGSHTTLVWPDGEKTTVGVGPDTEYDEYAGFCAAIVKKLFGSSREAEKFLDRVKIVQKKKAKKASKQMTIAEMM